MSESGGKQMRLALVIEAVDKASEKLEHINQRVNRLMEPINRVAASSKKFAEAAHLEKLQESYKQVGEAMEGVEQAGMKLFSLEAYIGAGGGALVEFFHHVAETGEQIEISARRAGLGVIEYQKLAYAFNLAGVDGEQFTMMMQFLNRNTVDALRGNTQMLQLFRAIGISWNDLRQKSPEEILYKISDWMQKFPIEARKSYVAQALLGAREGGGAVSALEGGPEKLKEMADEAQRLNKIMSKESIEHAGEFERSLKAVTAGVTALGNNVAADLMPRLSVMLERFDRWIDKNHDLIATRLGDFLDELITELPDLIKEAGALAGALSSLFGIINSVAKALGGWDKLIIVIAGARIAGFILSLRKLGVAIFNLVRATATLDIALATNPLFWIPMAIVAIYELYEHWDWVVEKVSEGIEWLADKLHDLVNLFHGILPGGAKLGSIELTQKTLPGEQGTPHLVMNGIPQIRLAGDAKLPATASNDSKHGETNVVPLRPALQIPQAPQAPTDRQPSLEGPKLPPLTLDLGQLADFYAKPQFAAPGVPGAPSVSVPTVQMREVATARTPASDAAAGQQAAANIPPQRVDVGGKIQVQIGHDGRPRVKSKAVKGPVDISVSHGPMAMGAAS